MKPQATELEIAGMLATTVPRFVSKKFVHDFTGGAVGTTRLWHLIKEEKVRAKRAGRVVLIDFESFQRWLADLPDANCEAMPDERRGLRIRGPSRPKVRK